MVHATVTRDSPDSFTVTFGDVNQTNRASTPEAASEATPNKMSPAPSKSASMVNVNAHKAQAIAMAKAAIAKAKAAIAKAKAAIDAADKATYNKTELTETDKNDTIKAGHMAFNAASDMLRAMEALRELQLRPDDMQGFVTTMMDASRKMKGDQDKQSFIKLRDTFHDAMIKFEQSISKVEKGTPAASPSSSSGTTLESWHATIEQVEADIQNVLANIDNNPTKAREEANKLSTTITTAYKGLSQTLQNTLKEDKNKISKKISDIFKTLGKRGVPSKGGRRTHRKRTHRKRTYRKRKSIQKIE